MTTISAHASSYVALAVISVSLGFWAGSAAARKKNLEIQQKDAAKSRPQEDSEEDSDSGEQDIAALRIDPGEECKLVSGFAVEDSSGLNPFSVLVVRSDLGMSAGKIAAQCSHATLACYKTLLYSNPTILRQWERSGQKKVALRCSDETELLTLQAQALSLNLCARSIQDAGRTQIAAGSRTVLGIAGPSRLVNQITGALRLL